MEIPELIQALREKRTMMCLNCGYEHNCKQGNCALMLQAAETLEKLSDVYRMADAGSCQNFRKAFKAESYAKT
ncbi:MAG: hypothetical protein ACFWUC_13345 [Oscillospiraceae bacterium]|jgi:hypothetical protein